MTLTAGESYAFEIIHKDGTGLDHLAVGWRKPSDGTGTDPAEIVPGSALSTIPVSAAITPNSAPYANVDDVTVPINSVDYVIDVVANDTDVDGDTIVPYAITTPPGAGSARIENGQVLYTPEPGWLGSDPFIVQVTDGQGGFDTANANVTVAWDNTSAAVIATPSRTDLNEDDILTLDITTYNVVADQIVIDWGDGTVDTLSGTTTQASHQYTTADPDVGVVVTAHPASGICPAIALDISVAPGATTGNATPYANPDNVTVPINSVDFAIDVAANDTDADGDLIIPWAILTPPGAGTARIENGQVLYTPPPGFLSDDPFIVQVTDGRGGFDEATVHVDVVWDNSSAAVFLAPNTTTPNEGDTFTIDLTTANITVDQFVVEWGDGTSDTYAGSTTQVSHVYTDGNADYGVTVYAHPVGGGICPINTVAIQVQNVAPTLTLSGDPMADVDALYTLSLASSDPGTDTITEWIIDWGDGTGPETITGNPNQVTHTYTVADDYTITATATDEDGTFNANTINVAVGATPGEALISAPQSSLEGAVVQLDISVTNAMVTGWVIDWGDGNTSTAEAADTQALHTYVDGDNGYTITATASTDQGDLIATTSITVDNVPPLLTINGPDSVEVGSEYVLSLSHLDVGLDTISSWLIDWGNGDTTAVAGDPDTVAYTYATMGSYQITASATDEDGTWNADPQSVSVVDSMPGVPADLSVTNFETQGLTYNPQQLSVGGVVLVDVNNLGPVDQNDPIEVLFFEDRDFNGAYSVGVDGVLGRTTVSDIAAGATRGVALDINGQVQFAGAPLWVWVDSAEALVETSELNNLLQSNHACGVEQVGSFTPVVERKVTNAETMLFSTAPDVNQIVSSPVVGDINNDGIVEIVFAAYDAENPTERVLRAVRGDNGAEVWTYTFEHVFSTTQSVADHPALGDLNGDGYLEVVIRADDDNPAYSSKSRLIAIDHLGNPLAGWADVELDIQRFERGGFGYGGAPSLVNLDNDLLPEVLYGRQIFDSDGTKLHTLPVPGYSYGNNRFAGAISVAVDLDLDGNSEIVVGDSAFKRTPGTGGAPDQWSLLWHITGDFDPAPDIQWSETGDGFVSVGNFDSDPFPELVHVAGGIRTDGF
ncbi:MAG: Ig-like domain-containing protein, partial [Planctomycetota bacterium]